jgi:hypothetical protein
VAVGVTADQLIALAGVALAGILAVLGGMWKLATMLAEVRTVTARELGHNGGSSLKDFARAARDEAIAAREQAQLAKHLAERTDAKVDAVAKAQVGIERRVRQVSDVVVGIQAVQAYREAVTGPPGSTVSSTTTTQTKVEGTT